MKLIGQIANGWTNTVKNSTLFPEEFERYHKKARFRFDAQLDELQEDVGVPLTSTQPGQEDLSTPPVQHDTIIRPRSLSLVASPPAPDSSSSDDEGHVPQLAKLSQFGTQ